MDESDRTVNSLVIDRRMRPSDGPRERRMTLNRRLGERNRRAGSDRRDRTIATPAILAERRATSERRGPDRRSGERRGPGRRQPLGGMATPEIDSTMAPAMVDLRPVDTSSTMPGAVPPPSA